MKKSKTRWLHLLFSILGLTCFDKQVTSDGLLLNKQKKGIYVKIEKSSKERPLGSTEGEDYIQSILLLLFRFLFMREFRKYIYLFRSHKDNPKALKS